LGFQVPKNFKNTASGFPLDISFKFGMAKHFKTPCDSHFGNLDRWTAERAKRVPLKTISDLITCWQTSHAEAVARGVQLPPELFLDFVPPPREEINAWCKLFTTASLGGTITGSHAWTFHCNDKRRFARANWYGHTAATRDVCTALDVKAQLMVGCPATLARTTWPVNRPEKAEESAAELGGDHAAADAEVDADAAELPTVNDGIVFSAKDFQGWRISYCAQEAPELKDYMAKVKRLENTMAPVRASLLSPRYGASREERVKRHQLACEKRKAASKAE
jgi:hypothetical protein